MENLLFKMEDINKSFGVVNVLKSISFEVKKGEVHALMGENGAGKSTLMKILGGIYKPDNGKIIFLDKEIGDMNPELAKELGIGFVHQELNLAESLTVAENIFMGRLPIKNNLTKSIDYKKLHKDTQRILSDLGATFNSLDIVEMLNTANKQLVEIAKALSLDAKVIIFDEPTTSLSDKDVDNLFKVISKLKGTGISCVYISHRMKEIFEICDRITILRDGEYISTDNIHEVTNDYVIKQMVGRELSNMYPKEDINVGDVILEVKNLKDENQFIKDISFDAKKGEILGFAGLVGAGRTELMRLLFGADKIKSGTINVNGVDVKIKNPTDAIKNKICLLTEDRKHQGLALNMSVNDNINMTSINNFRLNHRHMKDTSKKYVDALKIKISDIENSVGSLSGGNQQKVVLAKWLNTDTEIFIFDEPTKGIDVGAKSEIYHIMSDLARRGKVIIIVSSEIPELLGVCDRIYVMCEGKITGELKKDEATQENIMEYATIGGA